MTQRAIIAGGGIAGLEAALALRHRAGAELAITLVSSTREWVERPVTVAEPFALGSARRRDLGDFAARRDITFVHDEVVAVDALEHVMTTAAGQELEGDALVVAVGARPRDAVPGAITFPGAGFGRVVTDAEAGGLERIVFTQPAGATWPFPLIELALLTLSTARAAGAGPEVTLVTPEQAPLWRFGPAVSRTVSDLLAESGVRVLPGRTPVAFVGGGLHVVPGERIAADVVVATPQLRGPALPGLPADADGFLPVDASGRVAGAPRVWGAGDGTTFPVKHGGVAAQLADVAADSLCAELLGTPVPEPLHPVLQGTVLAGLTSRRIDADLSGTAGDGSPPAAHVVDWTHRKLAARHLSRWLDEPVAEVTA
jgi:sulfide:quinone oxidoreductase